MQNRHTLQGAAPRSEPPVSETESSDSVMRLRRADELERPLTADVPPGAEAKVVELSLSPTVPEPQASGKPPRWLGPIALALGVVCLGLASWLQLH